MHETKKLKIQNTKTLKQQKRTLLVFVYLDDNDKRGVFSFVLFINCGDF